MAVCDVADKMFRNEDGVRVLTDKQIIEYNANLKRIEDDASLGVLERAKRVEDLNESLTNLKKAETTASLEDALIEMDILMRMNVADKAKIERSEVILGVLDKSNTAIEGGRHSATKVRNSIMTEKISFLNRTIYKLGLGKLLDGAQDIPIANAVDMLTKGMTDADILAKGIDPSIIDVAKMLRSVMDMTHDDLIKANFLVSKREGYLGKQVYDSDLIKADIEGFKKAIRDNIDWDLTAPDLKDDMLMGKNTPATDSFFKRLYNPEESGSKTGGGVYSLGRERSIRYKSGANWVEVMRGYGRSKSLYTSVISAYEDTAKKVGLASVLGSKPAEMLDKLLLKVPRNKHKLIRDMFETYKGRSPAEGWYAKADAVRTMGSATMLGGSIFTALKSDPIAAAHALEATGFVNSVVEGYAKNFTTYMKNLPPEVRKETAYGILDTFAAESNALNRYLAESPDGMAASALNLTLKWNGLSQHTLIQATSAVEIAASGLKRQLKSGTLDPKTATFLKTHAINELDISILQKLPHEGTFTSEALRNLDIGDIEKSLPLNMDATKYKEKLLVKLRGAFEDIGFAATNTPTLRDKVTLEGSLDLNSISGQAKKFVSQYMSTVWRGGADMKYFSAVSGAGGLGIASMIGKKMVGAMAMYMFVQRVSDWAYDRVPEDGYEITGEHFFRAMGTSGIFGVYGDTIMGSLAWEQASFADMLGSPTVSLYGRGADMLRSKVTGALSGEDVEFSDNDVKTIIKMVPFTKLPYLYRPIQSMVETIRE